MVDLSRPNWKESRINRESLKSLAGLLNMALVESNLSRNATKDARAHLHKSALALKYELEGLAKLSEQQEITSDDLHLAVDFMQELLINTATLSNLSLILEDLSEILSDGSGALDSLLPQADYKESNHASDIEGIRYREGSNQRWHEMEVNAFLDLPRSERSRILMCCEWICLGENKTKIPPQYALRSLVGYISAPSAEELDREKAKLNVLLVDDDDLVCRSIKHKLLKSHERELSVLTAQSGIECLEIMHGKHKFKKISEPYIVFLDIQMPGCDGLETLATIRQTPSLESATVFMLTAWNIEDAKRRAEKLKCDGFVLKQNLWDFFNNLKSGEQIAQK